MSCSLLVLSLTTSDLFNDFAEELGLRIIPIDDVRCRLRTAGPTGTIGKEADCSYLHEELLVQQGENVTGGSCVFEGSVDNESQPVLLHGHSAWHSVPQCLVSRGLFKSRSLAQLSVWLSFKPDCDV